MENVKNYLICQVNDDKNIILFFKDGDGSNFNFLKNNQFPYIKYDGCDYYDLQDEKYNDIREDMYHRINFDLTEFPYFHDIINEFEKILDKKPNNKTYSDILYEMILLFQKYKQNIDIKKLHGDIGEALFIYKLIKLGYIQHLNDINFEHDDNDAYDFILFNKIFEIKTCSYNKSEIKVNHKQNKEEVNFVVIKVNYYQNINNSHYLNILDIYKLIKNEGISLNSNLLEKETLYSLKKDEINKHLIDINEVGYHFINHEVLPSISFKNENIIKRIVFVIDVTNCVSLSSEFEYLLGNIFS